MHTDNRQEIGKVADLGWLAGIVDGEGSITMLVSERPAKSGRKQSLRIQVRVIIGNADAGIISKVVRILDDLGIGKYVKSERPKPVSINGWSAYKQLTTVYVEGLERVRLLLTTLLPHLVGGKLERAVAALKFLNSRLAYAEERKAAKNLSYTQEDVENILAFLKLTRCKTIEHLSKVLNEHTRETRIEHRREKRHGYIQAAKDRRYVRPSRCALVSRENVRGSRNENPPELDLFGSVGKNTC